VAEVLGVIDQDDVLEGGAAREDLLPALHHVAVLQHRDLRAAVVDDVGDLLGRERVVDRHRRRGRVHRGGVGKQVLGDVSSHDRDEIAVSDAEAAQAHRDGARALALLGPGHGLPGLAFAP